MPERWKSEGGTELEYEPRILALKAGKSQFDGALLEQLVRIADALEGKGKVKKNA